MAKSQATFGKKDKERNKQKQRKEKEEKMAERKANAKKGKSLDEMMAYLDENGNITSTPPDPLKKKKTIHHSEILVSVPKQEDRPQINNQRSGSITFLLYRPSFNTTESGSVIAMSHSSSTTIQPEKSIDLRKLVMPIKSIIPSPIGAQSLFSYMSL